MRPGKNPDLAMIAARLPATLGCGIRGEFRYFAKRTWLTNSLPCWARIVTASAVNARFICAPVPYSCISVSSGWWAVRVSQVVTNIETLPPVELKGERPAARPIDMLHLTKQSLGDPGLELEILRMFDAVLSTHFDRPRSASNCVPDLLHHLHIIKAALPSASAHMVAGRACST